jgi:hypothetical protein
MTRKLSTKKQLEAIREEFQLKALQRAQKLMEVQSASDFWLTSYVDVLDRYRDGNTVVYPLSNPSDRRSGSNFPFWTSESQLAIIRASSRLIVGMNPAAYGLINGLTSYVIGSGFTYKANKKEGADADDKLVLAVQKVIDRFINDQCWKDMEQELFFRSREDGEAFLRLFPQADGKMQIRTVEPEQVIQPPDSTFEEWSYGIQTPPDDIFDIKAYYIHYTAPGGKDSYNGVYGEIVPSDQVIHIKANVKRGIKRGLPDLSFDTLETINLAGKLRRNMGEGAAVQAAIAAVRQHDTASASQVETFVQQAIDYSLNIPMNGRQQDYTRIDAGSFLDIPKGMNYIPPPGAANASAHLSIHASLLRAAGTRHNAPEWLVSGDASNNNYASSLTAESPFLRNCQRLQSAIQRPFQQVIEASIRNAIEAGRLPDDTLGKVEISVVPPTVETRNRGEEASSNQVYVNLGVKSRQKVAQELGLDWAKESAQMEEYNKKFGGQDGGGKKPPSGPGPDGPEGKPKPAPKAPPALAKAPEGLTEGKYDHIDFTPPKGAQEAAKRALAVRSEKPDSQQGMTPVGIARARDLSNGKKLSPETVKRMKAYFDRHQSDKSGESWDEQGKGWQAWMGWGGDDGYAWARKIVRQMDSADKVVEGWVTIGAKKKKGGSEKKGGTPVFIDKKTGQIEKGPMHTIGRKPSELKNTKKPIQPSSGPQEHPWSPLRAKGTPLPTPAEAPATARRSRKSDGGGTSSTGISGISFEIDDKPKKRVASKPKKENPIVTPPVTPPAVTPPPAPVPSTGPEPKPTDFTPKRAEHPPEAKNVPSNHPKIDKATDDQLDAMGRANAVETHRHSITGAPSFKLSDGTIHKIQPIENMIASGRVQDFATLFSEEWKNNPSYEKAMASKLETLFAINGSGVTDRYAKMASGKTEDFLGQSRELFRDSLGGVIDDAAGPNMKKYPELLRNSHFAHYKQEFDKEMARPTESVLSELKGKYGDRVLNHFGLHGYATQPFDARGRANIAMASVAMKTYEKLADNAHPVPKQIANAFPEIAEKSVKNLISGWDTQHGESVANHIREISKDRSLFYIGKTAIDAIKAETNPRLASKEIEKAIKFEPMSGLTVREKADLVSKYTNISDDEIHAKAKEMYGKRHDDLVKKQKASVKDPSKITDSEYSELLAQQGEARRDLLKAKNEAFLRDHAVAIEDDKSDIRGLMDSLKRKDSHKQLLTSKIGDMVGSEKIPVSKEYRSEVENAKNFVNQYSEIPIHDLVFFNRADGVSNGTDISRFGRKNNDRGYCANRIVPPTGDTRDMFKDRPVIFTPDIELTAKSLGMKGVTEQAKPFLLGNINSTLVHEIGHAVEQSDPFVMDMVNNFLAHRVRGEKPQQLNKVFPGTNYGDDETGRKDNFDKVFGEQAAWYVGKDYKSGSTEVLSMGIEKLKNDPGEFFAKDPEYAKFIMSVLQYKTIHEGMRKRGGA